MSPFFYRGEIEAFPKKPTGEGPVGTSFVIVGDSIGADGRFYSEIRQRWESPEEYRAAEEMSFRQTMETVLRRRANLFRRLAD